MRPSSIRIALGSLALAAGALATTHAAQASPQDSRSPALVPAATTTTFGCPYQYACVYTDAGWAHGSPSYLYYSYGCYTPSAGAVDMYVYNNQTPSARVTLFSGAGCTGAVVASLSQMDFFYGKAGVFRSVSLSH